MMRHQQTGSSHRTIAHSENGPMMSHIGNCHGAEGLAEENYELRETPDKDTDMEEDRSGKLKEGGDSLKGQNVRLEMVVVGMFVMRKNRQNCMDTGMDMELELEVVDMDLNWEVGIVGEDSEEYYEGMHMNFDMGMNLKCHNSPLVKH